MVDYIIIGILIVVIFTGIRSAVKHFKHESSCCGGGSFYKPPKKKLKTVMGKKTVVVEGMSCEHCKNRVQEGINDIKGASATVNLKKGIVVVSFEQPIEDDAIKKAVEKAGYTVVEIRG